MAHITDVLAVLDVTVLRKDESRFMRFLGALLGPDFMSRFWTTVSAHTIWAPVDADLSDLAQHEVPILHELVHVRQIRRWWYFFHIAYVALPIPFLFAWCRWAFEREAYLVNLRMDYQTVDYVVETIWRNYGWCWPRTWMRRWFRKQLEK